MTDDTPRYNRAFERLVRHDEDVEGLLAYSYYKRHKRAWLLHFHAENGRRPSDAEAFVFAEGVSVDDQLIRYRQQAQNALIAYATAYTEQLRPQIEKEAITIRIEQSAAVIENSAELWSLVKTGVVSTLLSTAVLILLAVGIRLFGVDLIDAVATLSGE